MKSKLIAVLAILLTVTLGHSRLAGSGQVVKNSYEDTFPHVNGDYLVWQGNVHGDWEILLYNIATQEFCRITDNDYDDISPQTDGDYVVWAGGSAYGGEIFLYEIATGITTQVTLNTAFDVRPKIANGLVVWESSILGYVIEPGDIYIYNIAANTTICLSASVDPGNVFDDHSPRFDGQRVTWGQDDGLGGGFVFIHDLASGTTTVAPVDFSWTAGPQRDGDLEVLTSVMNGNREIFVLNRSISGGRARITDNDIEDAQPCISGDKIAWVGGRGKASEIFLNADIDPIDTDFDPDEPDGPTPQGGSSGSSGGCFIATAAFGSPMEKHVTILTNFRDTYLLPHAVGRIFVRAYDKYSPPLAHFITKHEILKVAVRISLLPLVAVSYATLHFGPVITLSTLVLLILPIFLVSFYRRRAPAVR